MKPWAGERLVKTGKRRREGARAALQGWGGGGEKERVLLDMLRKKCFAARCETVHPLLLVC